MSTATQEELHQMVLPVDYALPYGQFAESLDLTKRLTLHRLIGVLSMEVALSSERTPQEAVQAAQPEVIEHGLYIGRDDERYKKAQQMVDLPMQAATFERYAPSAAIGVVFPSHEFNCLAHYPRALVRRAQSVTRARAERLEQPQDRQEVDARVDRSALHVLEGKILRMDGLVGKYQRERGILRSLHRDLKSSWRAHFQGVNLERARHKTDEKIHETAEVATINLNLGSVAVKGLHDAIRYNLYGHEPHQRLVENWRNYITMVGGHTTAKLDRVKYLKRGAEIELRRFKKR